MRTWRQGESRGKGCVEAVPSLLASEISRPGRGYCGYAAGVNLERGGVRENGEDSPGREGLSGSRSTRWQRGYRGLRKQTLLALAYDILGRPGKMGDLEPGYQRCLSRGGWM